MLKHTRLPRYAYVVGALVLVVALAMSAPGEYQLARAAGWNTWVAAGMPVCMSVYTAFAVWFVETRRKGERGRGTAVVGAVLALVMTLSGQVVAHWISAGDMQSSMALTAAVSSVPSIVVGHVAHMIIRAARSDALEGSLLAQHQETADDEHPDADPVQPTLDGAEPPAEKAVSARPFRRLGRPTPSDDEIREAAEALAAQGKEVNGPNLGEAMGRDRRTGSRYLNRIKPQTA